MTQQPDSTPSHSRDAIDLTQLPAQSTGADGGTQRSWVLDDVDQQSLQTLLQHAATVPLIIHLAAPSNPASDQIDAVLQPAIDARAGRMVMGRIDTEKHPQLLQMFGVPAGPMVVALMGQQALPLFNAPVAAEQLEQLLDEINASAVQAGMADTVPPLVEATDAEGDAVLPPLHQEAEAALQAENYDDAIAAYDKALAENPQDQEAIRGKARVGLVQRTRDMDIQQVRATAADNPNDVTAQMAVADLDLLGGHVQDAFDRLVKFIARSAGEDKDAARVHLLELYAVVGDDDARVATSRRKLAAALF
ncbi:co-chaperone YbbN [Enteractinococcus coprophilus]|uniref:Putative thioredoxin n=1 Tax=Enteractinococcus coprophilus TaxID=1027633 RepID=A0A543AIE2_9MICC|nr:tetratricopeptide repeat protein [Enteractinococcus coprophilus]TQL72347.1 putative thioredoxin [Enteractinococcus coprophilus]